MRVEDLAETVQHSYPKAAVQYLGFTARGPLSRTRGFRQALQRALPEPIDDRGPRSAQFLAACCPPAALGHPHRDLGLERDVELAAPAARRRRIPRRRGLRPLVLSLPKESVGQIGDPGRFVDAWAEIGVELSVRATSMTAFHPSNPVPWVMGWSGRLAGPRRCILETFLRSYPCLDQDDGLHAMLDRAASSTDRR